MLIHPRKTGKKNKNCIKDGIKTSDWRLIFDGSQYFEEVHRQLEACHYSALFANWQIDSRIQLNPSLPPLRIYLKELLNRKPTLHLYLLAWDHPSFYWFVRERWWQAQIWRTVHPRIHLLFDNEHPLAGSHHEKVAVFDSKVAICGGFDFSVERWDTCEHAFRNTLREKSEGLKAPPHHDLALKIKGPAVHDLQIPLLDRWHQLTGVSLWSLQSHDKKEITVAEGTFLISQTLPPHRLGIRRLFRWIAYRFKKTLWIEAQYFWSPSFTQSLIRRCRRDRFPIRLRASESKRIDVLLNPPKLLGGITYWSEYEELRLLSQLEEQIRTSGGRLQIRIPVSKPRSQTVWERPIYIHSKLMVLDDQILSIGSGNLSERTQRLDTELQMTLRAKSPRFAVKIRNTRQKLRDHWRSSPTVQLRRLNPKKRLKEILSTQPWLTIISWTWLFDAKPFFPRSKDKSWKKRNRITQSPQPHSVSLTYRFFLIIAALTGFVLVDPPLLSAMGILGFHFSLLTLIPRERQKPILHARAMIREHPYDSPLGVRSPRWMMAFFLNPARSAPEVARLAVRLRLPLPWLIGVGLMLRPLIGIGLLELLRRASVDLQEAISRGWINS